MYFYIRDNHFGDNAGGVSLNVVRVPAPTGWPFLLAGFGIVGLLVLRRRKLATPNAA